MDKKLELNCFYFAQDKIKTILKKEESILTRLIVNTDSFTKSAKITSRNAKNQNKIVTTTLYVHRLRKELEIVNKHIEKLKLWLN